MDLWFIFAALIVGVSCGPPPPKPLTAEFRNATEMTITFLVSGDDQLYGKPVTQIIVNYTYGNNAEDDTISIPIDEINDAKTFSQDVEIKNLQASQLYDFVFTAINKDGKAGPPSDKYSAHTLPATPDITVQHPQETKLVLKWSDDSGTGGEDFYEIVYSRIDKPLCNITMTISTCFAQQYSFDDLETKTTYAFSIRAHNPSGYSKPAIIEYPID